MKHYANQHRQELQLYVGDLVYLKLKPLAKKTCEKLFPRFYGHYKMKAMYGEVSYRLEFPATAKIHLVFHVSQLKRAVHSTTPTQDIPPFLTEELELQMQPEEVKNARKLINGDVEVLLKWEGLPEFECACKNYDVIKEQFPRFHLEDKVIASDIFLRLPQ